MRARPPLSPARTHLLGWRAPSAITVRIVLGLTLAVAGLVWMVGALPSLVWFGLTPVGLYRSLDQPPILLTLVGLWYTARSLRHRERGRWDEEDGDKP